MASVVSGDPKEATVRLFERVDPQEDSHPLCEVPLVVAEEQPH